MTPGIYDRYPGVFCCDYVEDSILVWVFIFEV